MSEEQNPVQMHACIHYATHASNCIVHLSMSLNVQGGLYVMVLCSYLYSAHQSHPSWQAHRSRFSLRSCGYLVLGSNNVHIVVAICHA